MYSLYVTIKELCVLHGCKPTQATNIMRHLRDAYAKKEQHKITWPEYASYYNVTIEDIKLKLTNKL